MSLWDVDKEGDKRDKPTPNQNDRVAQRMANATTSVHPVTTDTQQTGYLQTKNGRILVNDGTNDILKAGVIDSSTYGFETLDGSNVRTFAGNHSTLGEGFYVSKAGYDANSTGTANLIFNSNQDVFKIVVSGTTTIPTSGTSSSQVSIAHGLSTIPFLMASALVSGNYNPFPVLGVNDTTGVILGYYTCWADATNVYFRAAAPGSTVSTATPVKYYILQETAN